MLRTGTGEDLKDVSANVIDTAAEAFKAEYVEVRAQKLYKTAITVKEGRIEVAKQGIEKWGDTTHPCETCLGFWICRHPRCSSFE